MLYSSYSDDSSVAKVRRGHVSRKIRDIAGDWNLHAASLISSCWKRRPRAVQLPSRFKLPRNIEVSVTGVDFMSLVVSMPPEALCDNAEVISTCFRLLRPTSTKAGQGGYCGDFNGNPDDDAEPIIPSWDRPIGKFLTPVPQAHAVARHVLAVR